MNNNDNISMNSSRPIETMKEKANLYKELLLEKEEKIKELLEKNERLEKDCLKFQIHVRSLEDKLKTKNESQYVVKLFSNSFIFYLDKNKHIK
jgi:hypothetical protein